MGRPLWAKDTRPRKKRQWERIEENRVIDFPEVLKKRTYTEEIKRIIGLAFKGNHHADLFELIMCFKRIKNL